MMMERDQEWPEGSEPAEPTPGDDAGWFFDLPGGAWKRQEEKNRELRRRIVENIAGQANEPPAEEKQPRRGLFGRSKKGEDASAPRETAGGTFRLADDDAEPAGEPPPPPEASPFLRLHRRHAANDQDPDDEWSTEPADFRVTPFRSSRRDEANEAAAGGTMSRWDEMFGAGVEDSGIVEGMRSWAKGDAAPPVETEVEPPSVEPPVPTEPAAPLSRWDVAFGSAILPERELPAPPIDEPNEPALLDLPSPEPAPAAEQPLFEPPQPQPEPAEPAAATLWDSLLDTSADSGDIVEGMRRWAQASPTPVTRGNREERDIAPDRDEMVAGTGFGSVSAAQSGPASAWLEDEPVGEPRGPQDHASSRTTAEKPGLFRRIFGRKPREDEPAGMASSSSALPASAWLLPVDQDQEDALAPHESGDLKGTEPQSASAWLAPAELAADWTPPEETDTAAMPEAGDLESAAAQPASAWLAPAELATDWTPPEEEDTAAMPETGDLASAAAQPAEPAAGQTWLAMGEAEDIEPAVYWHIETPDELATRDVEIEEPSPPTLDSPHQLSFAASGEEDSVGWNPEPFDPGIVHPVSVAATAPTAEDAPFSASPGASWSGETDDDPWASLMAPALEASPSDAPSPVFVPGTDQPLDERSSPSPTGWETAAAHPWAPDNADSSPSPSAPPPIERGDVARWLETALEASEREPELPSDWRSSRPVEAPDASPTTPHLSSITAGDWQLDDDDDIVLKAFEAHARTEIDEDRSPDQPSPVPPPTTFSELLGNDGDALVAELTEPGAEVRPFSRFQGLAPQRTNIGETSAFAPSIGLPGADPGMEGALDAAFLSPGVALGDHAATPALTHGHSRVRTFVREAVETLLLAVLVFLAVRASFQNFKVDGSSMYPTLENGEFLIVNKLVYSEVDLDRLSKFIPFVDPGNDPRRNVFHAPQRGDIVVLKDPRDPQQDLIKRVIGLPGETLEIRDGKVFIGDRFLEEPYVKSAWHDSKSAITLGNDEYFVMGDNRENSLDSRSMSIGLIHKDLIIGKAMLSYWPSSKFGLAPNGGGTLAADVSTKDGKPVLTTQRLGE